MVYLCVVLYFLVGILISIHTARQLEWGDTDLPVTSGLVFLWPIGVIIWFMVRLGLVIQDIARGRREK